jgi:protein LSM14
VEIPASDYDFESANAKFNKKDLIKEAIATGDDDVKPAAPVTNGAQADGAEANGATSDDVVIPPAQDGFYNRGKSFFDNISCENKERAESKVPQTRGAQFRSEEQKKNLETFGQGSVDGFGGHYRGWRGRGRGYRGSRGYGYRGRGGFRQPQQGAPVGN